MSQRWSALLMAAVFACAGARLAAHAQTDKKSISLGKEAAGLPVDFMTRANEGKGIGKVSDDGHLPFDPLLSNGKTVVIREDCPDKHTSRILIADPSVGDELLGSANKDGCTRKKIATLLPTSDGVSVTHAGGLPTKTIIVGGAAATTLIGVLVGTGGGGSSPSSTTTTTTSSPSSNGPPTLDGTRFSMDIGPAACIGKITGVSPNTISGGVLTVSFGAKAPVVVTASTVSGAAHFEGDFAGVTAPFVACPGIYPVHISGDLNPTTGLGTGQIRWSDGSVSAITFTGKV